MAESAECDILVLLSRAPAEYMSQCCTDSPKIWLEEDAASVKKIRKRKKPTTPTSRDYEFDVEKALWKNGIKIPQSLPEIAEHVHRGCEHKDGARALRCLFVQMLFEGEEHSKGDVAKRDKQVLLKSALFCYNLEHLNDVFLLAFHKHFE